MKSVTFCRWFECDMWCRKIGRRKKTCALLLQYFFFLYTAVIVEITPPTGKVIFPRVDEPTLLAGIDCATLQPRQSINLAKAL